MDTPPAQPNMSDAAVAGSPDPLDLPAAFEPVIPATPETPPDGVVPHTSVPPDSPFPVPSTASSFPVDLPQQDAVSSPSTVADFPGSAPRPPSDLSSLPPITPSTVPAGAPVVGNPYLTTYKKKKKVNLSAFLIPLIVFLLLILGISTVASLIVYDVIPLKNKDLREKLSALVFKIPGIPKTKEYVLGSMIAAQEDVTSAEFSLSLDTDAEIMPASSGDYEAFSLGISGKYDLYDQRDPKISLNVGYANMVDLDFFYADEATFFRINELGIFALLDFLELPANFIDPFLNVWVHIPFEYVEEGLYDTLNYDAEDAEPLIDPAYLDALQVFTEDELFPLIEMTQEDQEGTKMYRFSLNLDQEDFLALAKKLEALMTETTELLEASNYDAPSPSYRITYDADDANYNELEEVLDSINFDIWVDSKTFYLRKFSSTLALNETFLDSYDPLYRNNPPYDESYYGGTDYPDFDYSDYDGGMTLGAYAEAVLGAAENVDSPSITYSVELSGHNEPLDFTPPEDYVDVDVYFDTIENHFEYAEILSEFPPSTPEGHTQFMQSFATLSVAVTDYWAENSVPPESLYDITGGRYSEYKDLIELTASPSANIVVLYGWDPLPELSSKPFVATVFTNREDPVPRSYSYQGLLALFESLDISADYLPEEDLFAGTTVPWQTGSGALPGDPSDDVSPFGRYLE
jgi:hypothetical protein